MSDSDESVGADSDETVGEDSDETLPPPDSRDSLNYSPDLFDDATYTKSKESDINTERSRMNKQRSKVHDLSDSDSDTRSDVVPRQKASDSRKSSGTGSQHEHSHDKKETNTDSKSPKAETSFKPNNRQKFMKDFLDMTDSESDDDLGAHDIKYKDNKRGSHEYENKSKSDHITHSPNLSVTNKPHKKDYSKPFTETKHKTSTNVSNSLTPNVKREKNKDGERKYDESHRLKSKHGEIKQLTDQVKKVSYVKESPSPNTTLKRKLSRSPVPHELRKAATEILNIKKDSVKDEHKPRCKYGSDCYRMNPSHLEEYSHPVKKSKSSLSASPKDSPPPTKKRKLSIETPSTSKHSLVSRTASPSTNCKREEMASRPGSALANRTASPSTYGKTDEMASRSRSPLAKRTASPSKNGKVDEMASISRSPPRTPKNVSEKYRQAQPYSFFLTKVSGIHDKYNSSYAMDIKEILSPDMGNLTASCQFNFMFEIPWLIKQYPPAFRSKPLLIVHGEQGPSKARLQGDAMTHTNIRFCQAKLEMMYGTHHTKMMLLLYDSGMRVVIHTSNLIESDWFKKTQGMWISPVFPKLAAPSKEKGESPTFFKKDLMNYIAAYKAYQLKEWIEHIEHHDMSSARAVLVASFPGRHQGDMEKSKWGHLKLRKVLKQHGPDPEAVKSWPVIGQFSSIGSMGPRKENWVCGEFLESMATTKSSGLQRNNVRLQLIFPSKDNVRLSLEGFPAGGSIPYTTKTAMKQTYLHDFFHVWTSEGRGRTGAMPHIKSYIRPKQDGTVAAWFLVTSANLSKAAWGALEKNGIQLMIRSYEVGVLFLPKFFGNEEVFGITNDINIARSSQKLILPYDLPAQKYEKKDRPWMWDIPYMDLPDTNGNVWCPFSK